jgi:hypothetical protein
LAVLSLVVGAAVPVARAADVSGNRNLVAESKAAATDTPSFLDEEMAQSVRTVERTETRQQTVTRVDSIKRRRKDLGSALGDAIGSAVGTIVEQTVPPIVEGAVGASLSATLSSTEALTNAIKSPNAKQGRSDDRPALLASVLKSDTSAALRRVAAWGLANYADNEVAAEALAGALRRDADVSVREMAAWALADAHKNSTVIDALSTAFRRDASSKVRASAAWALGNIGDRDAVEALAAALGDSSRGVRLRAVWADRQFRAEDSAEGGACAALGQGRRGAQLAAWALFNIQDPDAVPATRLGNASRDGSRNTAGADPRAGVDWREVR